MAQVIQAKPPALHEKQIEVLKALKKIDLMSV